ncbi:MAG: hypothetical protein ACI82F_003115, partial [Planctomycetota bacterium]
MNLKQLIEKSWARHEVETEAVATELEEGIELLEGTDPEGVAAFMHLVNHAIGDHGADRARALRACESAFGKLTEGSSKSPLLHLAVARHLAGDQSAAAAAEAELGDGTVGEIQVRLQVAQGKSHEKQWGESAALYYACLESSDSLGEGHGAEQATAVASNNIASALLHAKDRDELQSELMERAAQAARKYWLRVGEWTQHERADYLLALVHNSLGRHREALAFAERGLKTIADNGGQKVDQAFIYLTIA